MAMRRQILEKKIYFIFGRSSTTFVIFINSMPGFQQIVKDVIKYNNTGLMIRVKCYIIRL